MSGLVVLQVADAGISTTTQQQPDQFLLIGASVQPCGHVEGSVSVSLRGDRQYIDNDVTLLYALTLYVLEFIIVWDKCGDD